MPERPPPTPKRARRNPRVGGKYELLEEAGRGGMAKVYRAYQHGPGKFRRTVAVKHMHPYLAEQDLYRAMFMEEARIGAALQDPNIAQVYDFVISSMDFYLILEWVEGIDLSTYIHYVIKHLQENTRWQRIVGVGIGVMRALAAAHERTTEDGEVEPIVHRDVTPHNILISVKGPAKLIDFGLCLARDRKGRGTDPGVAKGKAAYLAPEIVRGGRPTPASDQFTTGAVMWEALVGRRLFEHPSHFEMLKRIATADVRPLDELRPDLPADLVALVHRALARDPDDRFPSMRAMAGELGSVLAASTSREDLYAGLAETVIAARKALGIGRRTQGPAMETPVPEGKSGLVELEDILAVEDA